MTRPRTFKAAFDAASAGYCNHMAMLSMSAYTQFCELVDQIEGTRYYRMNAKQELNRCKKWYDDYWKREKEVRGGHYPLYVDFANQCAGLVERDVQLFFFSIKSALDKQRVKDSDLKAQILLVAELIRVSAEFHESYWEKASEYTGYHDLGKFYWYADPTSLLSIYSGFAAYICTQADADVLSGDQNCETALSAILRKCENDDKLGMAARDAIMLNAEQHPEWEQLVREVDEKRAKENEQPSEREDMIEKLKTKFKVTEV